jgi:uncharacterized protein YxeA
MTKKTIILGTVLIVVVIFAIMYFNNETPGGGNKNVQPKNPMKKDPPLTTGTVTQERTVPDGGTAFTPITNDEELTNSKPMSVTG